MTNETHKRQSIKIDPPQIEGRDKQTAEDNTFLVRPEYVNWLKTDCMTLIDDGTITSQATYQREAFKRWTALYVDEHALGLRVFFEAGMGHLSKSRANYARTGAQKYNKGELPGMDSKPAKEGNLHDTPIAPRRGSLEKDKALKLLSGL